MSKTQRKRRPTTPGEILREEYLIPMGITQKKLADHIGVDVKVINRIVNERSGLTPEMAVKLGYALGTSPQFWINAQVAVDIWDAEQNMESVPHKLA